MSSTFYRSEAVKTLLPIFVIIVGAVIVGMDAGRGNLLSIPLLVLGGIFAAYLLSRYPFVSFLVLMVATWYDTINPFMIGGFTLNRVMAFAILAAVLVRHILSGRRERLIFTRFDFFMAMHIIAITATVLFYGEGIRTFYQYNALFVGYFYYWFAVNLIDDERKLQILGLALIVCTIPIATTTVLAATDSDIGRRFTGFQSYTETASLSVLAILFLLYLTLGRAGWTRIAAIAMMVLFGLAIGLTGTRSAVIGLFAAVVTIILFMRARTIIPLLVAAVLIFVVSLQLVEQIAPTVLQRFTFVEEGIVETASEDLSWANRLQVYERALHAFETNPIIGIGYGQLWNWAGFSRSSHNVFLNALGETGLIGTLPLLAAYAYLLIELIRLIRKAPDPITRQKLIFLLGMLVFHNISFANFSISNLERDMFFVFGLAAVPIAWEQRAAVKAREEAQQARSSVNEPAQNTA